MSNRYISKYSNGKSVSPAQYITEIICENKAKQDKEDLHYRFWLNKKWASYYRNQIATANQLVKKHSPEAIIAALKSSKAQKIYSLRSPFLKSIIEQQEVILSSQNTDLTIALDRKENKVFEKSKHKNGILSKLKELDNE